MSDEPTPELRALAAQLFAAGRAERPGPALGRRLLLIEPPTSGASGTPASDVAPRAAASVSRGRGMRSLAFIAAAAAIAVASVGSWGWLDRQPVFDMSPDPVSPRAQERSPSPSSRPSELGAMSQSLPAPVERAADRVQAPPQAPARVAAPARVRPKRAAREPEPSQRSRVTTTAERPLSAVLPAVEAAAATPAPAPAAPAPVEPAPAAETLGLSEELALLKEARFALRAGDAKRALDVLDRHSRTRAADSLHAEASLLRMEALAALGRRAEASQLATRFVRENPFSALADRARSFITASGAAP
jgi:hypothetical protein